MKQKFPVKIVLIGEQKKRFSASTSIDILSEKGRNVRQELEYIEQDYSILIENIRHIIAISSQNKKTDPRLYWLVGEAIIRFLERMDDIGFYLLEQNTTLSRDIGISESSIKKIVSFRIRFSKLRMVNPTIPWTKYRDNKVPVPK